MSMRTALGIDIASEFDNKGFKQAETAMTGLQKSVGKLGAQLAGVFTAGALANFAKNSVKAFMEDQKAAAALANELKNVGLSYSTPAVENFIQSMQKQTGVLDDQLRPAYAQLVRVLGSTTETQKTLTTAWNISEGTGNDLQSVVDALSQAYVGNTKGLKSLNTGLTQTELKTKTYSELIDILNKKFAGAGAASLDTYAGKVKLLQASFADAQETIGKGFLDAFSQIAGDQNFMDVTDAISNMATYVADTIRGMGDLLAAVDAKTPSWLKTLISNKAVQSAIYPLKNLIAPFTAQGKQDRLMDPLLSAGGSYFSKIAADKQAADADAKAKARAKALADAIKAQNKAAADLVKKKKEAAALDALSLKYLQAARIFNDEQIQIAAALANPRLTSEDQIRLNLKKDILALQDAIQAKDIEGATALAAKIDLEYKQLGLYQSAEKTTASIAAILAKIEPIDLINIANLQDALAKLLQLQGLLSPAQKAQAAAGQAQVDQAISNILATDLANAAAEQDVTSMLGTPFNPNVVSNYGVGNPNLQNVTVTIVDNTSGLIDVVTNATQQASANGISTRILRNTGSLEW